MTGHDAAMTVLSGPFPTEITLDVDGFATSGVHVHDPRPA